MTPEFQPLIIGLLIFLASLISLKLSLPVAILEITLGAIAGTLGMEPSAWMDIEGITHCWYGVVNSIACCSLFSVG